MSDVVLLSDPLLLDHRTELVVPSHPERRERLARLLAALDPPPPGTRHLRPGRDATVDDLARVHDRAYLDHLLAQRDATGLLDEETPISPASIAAALRAAGTAIALVDLLLDGEARAGFALVRPPGHHALPNRAMGFCLLNNIAIAAAHARARGLGRVLIVDWDVHLGNGTQAMFRARRDVLVIDLHQDQLYPPGGAADDVGEGEGRGFTVNVPVPAGAGDAAIERALVSALDAHGAPFAPDLILVSAGFDAHARDPEGGLMMSAPGFAALTRAVRSLADRTARGRVGMILEGGYDVEVLAPCVRACIAALTDPASATPTQFP